MPGFEMRNLHYMEYGNACISQHGLCACLFLQKLQSNENNLPSAILVSVRLHISYSNPRRAAASTVLSFWLSGSQQGVVVKRVDSELENWI